MATIPHIRFLLPLDLTYSILCELENWLGYVPCVFRLYYMGKACVGFVFWDIYISRTPVMFRNMWTVAYRTQLATYHPI